MIHDFAEKDIYAITKFIRVVQGTSIQVFVWKYPRVFWWKDRFFFNFLAAHFLSNSQFKNHELQLSLISIKSFQSFKAFN